MPKPPPTSGDSTRIFDCGNAEHGCGSVAAHAVRVLRCGVQACTCHRRRCRGRAAQRGSIGLAVTRLLSRAGPRPHACLREGRVGRRLIAECDGDSDVAVRTIIPDLRRVRLDGVCSSPTTTGSGLIIDDRRVRRRRAPAPRSRPRQRRRDRLRSARDRPAARAGSWRSLSGRPNASGMKSGGMPPICRRSASAPVSTQRTPGAAFAAAASIAVDRGVGVRRCTGRRSIGAAVAESADKLARCRCETWSSTRRTACPIPNLAHAFPPRVVDCDRRGCLEPRDELATVSRRRSAVDHQRRAAGEAAAVRGQEARRPAPLLRALAWRPSGICSSKNSSGIAPDAIGSCSFRGAHEHVVDRSWIDAVDADAPRRDLSGDASHRCP